MKLATLNPFAKNTLNNAGGAAFRVDPFVRLNRFLMLGSEGGTYYVAPRKLTLENADNLRACLALDGSRTVREIVEVSESGRAPRQDPAVFALAVAACQGDERTRTEALAALPMLWARKHKVEADTFVILTDNETWYGSTTPMEALRQYRAEMGIDASLVVVGMTATPFSIADPDDPKTLDVAGFDATVPQVVASAS